MVTNIGYLFNTTKIVDNFKIIIYVLPTWQVETPAMHKPFNPVYLIYPNLETRNTKYQYPNPK